MTRERDRIQENANKYIVKNCPCLFNSYYASGKTVRFECNDGNHDDKLCRDVTDCVIKQVVEKCNGSKLSYSNLEILRTACETNQVYGKAVMAEQILRLFDIEEINK